MKNVHILPTDKPSRLILQGFELFLSKYNEVNEGFSEFNQNIYITNNEDINENDYIITSDGKLVQVSYLLSKDVEGGSKIILTTDQDLINDGIQSIDDEFLEWFVNNSSCDYIKVEPEYEEIRGEFYKLIIPDELIDLKKQFQIKADEALLLNSMIGESKKQETLEEAAKKYALVKMDDVIGANGYLDPKIMLKNSFIEGAKWQQERMYSEKDLMMAYYEGHKAGLGSEGFKTFKEFMTFLKEQPKIC